jgi:hypothetical protein
MIKRLLIASVVMLSDAPSAMAQQLGYFPDTSGAYATAFTSAIVYNGGRTATYTLTPTGKPWGPHLVATPNASVPGTFSPATINPTVGSSDPLTFTFTQAGDYTGFNITLNATVGPIGATSAPYTVPAPLPPDAPTLVVRSITPTSITVNMTFASTGTTANSGNIDGNGPNGDLGSSYVTPRRRDVTFTGLTPSTSYSFTGYSNNYSSGGGYSPASATVTGTTSASGSAAYGSSFTSAVSASSGAVGSPVVITSTPSAGGWNGNELTFQPSPALAGTFTSGGVTGGPFIPPAGSTSPYQVTFTPSAAGFTRFNPGVEGMSSSTYPSYTAN